MNFSTLDIAIVAVYLIGIALFGVVSGGRQKSARDYFLSETAVPWWAVCFAIVATETSALTFLSIPGLAYATNFNFLQVAIGYLIGRIIVARFFLPRYFEGRLSTAYAYLDDRFGGRMRRSASVVFLGTRLFADGVRLYTTAIPLALLLQGFHLFPGLDETNFYLLSIAVLSALTLVYVFLGGVRAVIWTDVAQLAVYLLGAACACAFLANLLPGSLGELWRDEFGLHKMQVLNLGLDESLATFWTKPYTLAASLIGGMFLSMASHGTDQIIIQRVLTTNHEGKARRAMVMSGVIVVVQFALFLLVGALLYLFYLGKPISPNEVFAKFILEELPSGLSGIIVAGILAAAMSTLSGSISALASSTMLDIIVPLRKASWDERQTLQWSRRISILWGIALVGVATLFIGTPKTVVELALSIASYTYGGLLGVFLLGLLFRTVREPAALIAFFAGIAGMTAVVLLTPVAWTWYTMIGAGLTITVGVSINPLLRSSRGALR